MIFKKENTSLGVNDSDVNAIPRVVSCKVTLQEVKRSSPLITSLGLHASAHTLM
jgi:hypothetical protein